jgi:predicted hotdog family 3-hydroxylacyl-ACP dehydratase
VQAAQAEPPATAALPAMPALPAIADLIPHSGSMCLLERIVAWDDTHVHLATQSHARADNPLRHAGHLSVVMLCEYGAQATAVHGGLLASRTGGRAPPGFLVSLREVSLAGVALEALSGDIEVKATRLHGDGNGWQYSFAVSHAGHTLASGRTAIMLRRASPGS